MDIDSVLDHSNDFDDEENPIKMLNRSSSETSFEDLLKSSYQEDDFTQIKDREYFNKFEEVEWVGFEKDDERIKPVHKAYKQAYCRCITSGVFWGLAIISSIFLYSALENGGFPVFGTARAVAIEVPYHDWWKGNGDVKPGQWDYYKFQTHHTGENIITDLLLDEGTENKVYLYINIDNKPSLNEGKQLSGDINQSFTVCGPKTVYVGVTSHIFPLFNKYDDNNNNNEINSKKREENIQNPFDNEDNVSDYLKNTTDLVYHYELKIMRTNLYKEDECKDYSFWENIEVNTTLPLFVITLFIIAIGFCIWSGFYQFKASRLQKRINYIDTKNILLEDMSNISYDSSKKQKNTLKNNNSNDDNDNDNSLLVDIDNDDDNIDFFIEEELDVVGYNNLNNNYNNNNTDTNDNIDIDDKDDIINHIDQNLLVNKYNNNEDDLL